MKCAHLAVNGLLLASLLCAQAGLIAPSTIRDLHDARWRVRKNAFERLHAIPGGESQQQVKSLLISLREKENAAAEGAGPDLFEDDDYLAYDSELTKLVERIAESSDDAGAWKSLAYMRYNGDSVYGRWLADHSSRTLPFLSRQLDSSSSVRRMTAVYVVALCLTHMRSDSTEYRNFKGRIRHLAIHDIAPVSQSAMQGLAVLKDPADVPLLMHLSKAATDKYSRAAALEAAQSIQKP